MLAVDGGEAAALIENGRSGFLVPDDQAALADAIRWLVAPRHAARTARHRWPPRRRVRATRPALERIMSA